MTLDMFLAAARDYLMPALGLAAFAMIGAFWSRMAADPALARDASPRS